MPLTQALLSKALHELVKTTSFSDLATLTKYASPPSITRPPPPSSRPKHHTAYAPSKCGTVQHHIITTVHKGTKKLPRVTRKGYLLGPAVLPLFTSQAPSSSPRDVSLKRLVCVYLFTPYPDSNTKITKTHHDQQQKLTMCLPSQAQGSDDS